MGIARLALAALGALGLIVLIVLGVISLTGGFGPAPEAGSSPPPETKPLSASSEAPASSETSSQVPTVLVECLQERCPTVFLKVTGGDVLFNREMTRGEQAQSSDDKVDVVLTDASAVRVRVNGSERPAGKAGERQEFTASRE
ncbi:hypothetical protein GCM10010156_20850 [Planobispora rosea]|uniref:DUF4115 domain-containing protein n=1 Tax=Planobispora rosea TaxID=35762 RepID=A0A8J3S3Q8_PLARO|nr:hypothetical protein [Planobispora rosea]GGS61938.1 hypothetical protein GCM10010156_20850 [Planobispora rosea]GIH86588.1 hypothetical protein Pro02_49960 [Planobispora rosea]